MKEFIRAFCEEYDYPLKVCDALLDAYQVISADEKAIALLERNQQMLWQEQFTEIGDDLILLDQIADNNETKWFEKLALKDAIEELDEREKLIVFLRYFKDQTQAEVADRLGISQVQVSRLEKKILQQIKLRMKE